MLYNTFDNALGFTTGQAAKHEEKDITELQKVFKGKPPLETIQFLTKHQMEFDSFTKGNEFVVSMCSFQLVYDSSGKLTVVNTY